MAEAQIYAETTFKVGTETFLDSGNEANQFAVVFEDDGKTGYFYALDRNADGNPILDALHIYNEANVTDKGIPSKAQIVWSGDKLKALLLINSFPHAAFDFAAKRGYCRMNFPPPSEWTRYSHAWDDDVMLLF